MGYEAVQIAKAKQRHFLASCWTSAQNRLQRAPTISTPCTVESVQGMHTAVCFQQYLEQCNRKSFLTVSDTSRLLVITKLWIHAERRRVHPSVSAGPGLPTTSVNHRQLCKADKQNIPNKQLPQKHKPSEVKKLKGMNNSSTKCMIH